MVPTIDIMTRLENERIAKLRAVEEAEIVLEKMEKMKIEMEKYQNGMKVMENKIEETYKNEHHIEVYNIYIYIYRIS